MHLAVLWFFTDKPTGGGGRERERQTDRQRQTDRENREACGPFRQRGWKPQCRRPRKSYCTICTHTKIESIRNLMEREREGPPSCGSAVSRRDPSALKNEVKKITFVPARIYPYHHERYSVRLAAFQRETACRKGRPNFPLSLSFVLSQCQ